MKNILKYRTLLFVCLISMIGFAVTSCDDDDLDTSQMGTSGITLKSYGPSPALRGSEIRFIGDNVDKVTAVTIPGAGDISEFTKKEKTEIRLIVPQNAEVGYPVLKTPQGEITAQTLLTFEEPISISSITTAKIKAGSKFTIEGDYLNLIAEVIFSDNIVVAQENFVSQDRKKIEVIVPVAARPGKIIISNGAEIPIEVYSDTEANIVEPVISSLSSSSIRAGADLIINGSDLDLIASVVFGGGIEAEKFTVNGEATKITVAVPHNAQDGAITLIAKSGLEYASQNLTLVVPTELKVTPATNIRPGDVITISGKDLDLVTSIIFPGVEEAVTPSSISATEIKVDFPDAAISGDVTLTLGSTKEVTIAVATLKPAVSAFNPNPAFAGSEVEIKGANLDLVASVIFGGDLSVEVENPAAESFSVNVPTLANSGNVTLVMKNGETVDGGNLTVDKPVACYISIFPDEEIEIQAGNLLAVGVENANKLVDVQVKGRSTQYILQGNSLYILIPVSAFGKEVPVILISSNGQVEYTFNIIAAGFVENTIWSGILGPIDWSGSHQIPWSYFEGKVETGSTIRVHYSTIEGGQVEIMGLWWNGLQGPKDVYGTNDDGRAIIAVEAGTGYLEFKLTSGDVDILSVQAGMLFCGGGVTISKVSVIEGGSPEIELWKGSIGPIDWSGSHMISMDGILEQLEAGQTMGIEFSSPPGGQVEIMGSWWTGLEGPKEAYGRDGDGRAIIPVEGDGTLEFTLFQGDIDILSNQGSILFCGNDVVIKRIWVK